MTEHPLTCHPATPAPWLESVVVRIEPLGAGGLTLTYVLQGDLARLALPSPGEPRRVDGLWRETCCELFLARAHGHAYREYNFSPSEAWQAYDFDAYRSPPRLAEVATPRIVCAGTADVFELSVALPSADLPEYPRLRLGLSAVVQARNGLLSYWALTHPAPQPDFHHPDAFILKLDLSP